MHYKTILLSLPAAALFIGAGIDLANLDNYANQGKPAYITKDNTTQGNAISNKGATLGRVLFYDKKLSVNNNLACASCHKQQFAFGDTAKLSIGTNNGLTTRHAMRLVNARFADEKKFFWNERANTLEDQTSQPIQNHDEMGYSGLNGDPDLNALIAKMNQISYYPTLFSFVYGDPTITEARIQKALAQFVRSIQSFDSRFDAGLAQANNLNAPFQNYTALENQGKTLFLAPPPQGGAGCQACHRAPEFDIDPNTKNNGVIAVAANPTTTDLNNTRAPSLRDLFNPNGNLNTPLMHNASFTTINQAINHYNQVPLNPANTNLDPRLAGPGGNLQLTQNQQNALIAFLKTLSGNNIYTDPKWSDPFDAAGNLTGTITGIKTQLASLNVGLYPNPVQDYLQIELEPGNYQLRMMDAKGQLVYSDSFDNSKTLDMSGFTPGIWLVEITERSSGLVSVKKIIKE